MKQRCYNPNTPKFYNYGGRGIIVCGEWKNYIMNTGKSMEQIFGLI